MNRWVEQLKKFYDIFKMCFDESLAGKVPDDNAIMEEVAPILEERDRIEAEIETARAKIAELKQRVERLQALADGGAQ